MSERSPYEVVVIGSGIGGLTAALACAREGRRVAVLEAEKQFGGYINPFKRKHYWFDTGIHYIGELGPGQSLRHHLEKLELYDAIGFRELNPEGFDRYVFPDYEVRMGRGADRFRDRLALDFPHERPGIDKFFGLLEEASQAIRKATKLRDWKSALPLLRHAPLLYRYRKATFAEMLDDCVRDRRLRAALAGPGGDIGLPPARVSGFMMLGLLAHYLGGAFFPKGGSKAVRDAYVEALRSHGAELHRNTRVERILTSGGRVRGVRNDKGEEFLAPVVISNADAAHTLGTMLGEEHLGWNLRRKVARTTQSLGSLCAFVGTDLNPADHGLDDANIWSYPSYDIDSLYEPVFAGRFSDVVPFFLTVPTLKDPDGSHAPEGKHTVELITFCPYGPFRRWKDQPTLKRDEDYRALKEQLGMTLLERAETFIPGLRDHMEVYEFATPLTNTSFANAPMGAIYGPEHSPRQFALGRYQPKGPVDGLYLCGASTFSAGIGACVASGVVAARMAMRP